MPYGSCSCLPLLLKITFRQVELVNIQMGLSHSKLPKITVQRMELVDIQMDPYHYSYLQIDQRADFLQFGCPSHHLNFITNSGALITADT